MSKVKLACTLPWREIVGAANPSLIQMSKVKLACTLPWREIVGAANISLIQMSKVKLACTLPWREIVGAANPSLIQMSKVQACLHFAMARNCRRSQQKTRTKCSRLCACFQAFTAIKKKKRQTIFTVCRLVSE